MSDHDVRGIGNPRIAEAFDEHLPKDSTYIVVPRLDFVAFAGKQPTIQKQIKLGIYRRQNLAEELLSVAWSWPRSRLVAVCFSLIRWHMRDVPLTFAYAYAQAIALHEAHHLRYHARRLGWKQQLQREIECNKALEAHHPEIAELAYRATELSPTISRVMDRAERIGGHHHVRRGL